MSETRKCVCGHLESEHEMVKVPKALLPARLKNPETLACFHAAEDGVVDCPCLEYRAAEEGTQAASTSVRAGAAAVAFLLVLLGSMFLTGCSGAVRARVPAVHAPQVAIRVRR